MDYMVNIMFCCIKKLPLSSTVAVAFYIPTSSRWESFFSAYLPTFATVSVLNFDCYNRRVVVSLFYLEIHWWHMLLSISFYAYFPSVYLLWWGVWLCLLPIFNWFVHFYYWVFLFLLDSMAWRILVPWPRTALEP